MHRFDEHAERLAEAVRDYARRRLRMDPVPLDRPRPYAELAAAAGQTVTAEGLGWEEALRIYAQVLAPATVSVDNPRYLAFIPSAPTEAATLFDLVVGASSIYGGSWLEGAGGVYAENQALRWVCDLAGLPAGAGGCFVSGGTSGNLAALVTARHTFRASHPGAGRLAVAATAETHSSIASAAGVMDVELLPVPGDERGRMTGDAQERAIADRDHPGLFAVAATAGTTNAGIVDDLEGVARVCRKHGLWMHVDGAYGAAALAAPTARGLFAGIEHADSLIVDPHKWLYAPFDCCALVYRAPELARTAHAQSADYLEPMRVDGAWDPSDYAVHLSRRARGLPFWFSLAAHGSDAYQRAIECTLDVARAGAEEIKRRAELELLIEPELSVLVFRRVGWTADDYNEWSGRLLAEGVAFVMPTIFRGETATRFAIVNPRTTVADLTTVLDTMA
ncbi:MAG: pyridoxal phosphate-dependent decarboxylase family protein [Gaiellales bacterium]